MYSPLVSIIIPVYKNLKWLPETINSVFNQNYNNYEIIIINDCSPENVESFLLPYTNNKIHYYEHTVNKGAGGARNTGISKCSGEYILPLDSDDVIHDANWLVDSIKKINENTIVTSQICLCDENMNLTNKFCPLGTELWSDVLYNNVIINSSMYPKSMWTKLGGYDESRYVRTHEDWEFWIRAYKAGYNLIRINKQYLHYRIHKNNWASQNINVINKLRRYVFGKHNIKKYNS
jgi:glycosyltransferase involved in cell wall biosynthesis